MTAIGVAVPLSARAVTPDDCTLTHFQELSPPDTSITLVSLVSAAPPLPEYCKVEASVATPGNVVNFRLGLPTSWNGKFLQLGNGGFAGSIESLDEGLTRGYAAASTDTGHQAFVLDASWALDDDPKGSDFGYRGVHAAVVAAKSLTTSYYASAPQHAYLTGCSNGGRQALMEAQRFPADFDGLVVGAPALDFTGLMTGFNWNAQAVFGSPAGWIPAEKRSLVAAAVTAECDGVDGLIDGFVDDPRLCAFDPASLQCTGDDAPTCLTADQVASVEKIYGGPKNSAGESLYEGFPRGGEDQPAGWAGWITGNDGSLSLQFVFQDQFLKYLAFAVDDPTFDCRSFDFDTTPPLLAANGMLYDATDPDLGSSAALGAKILVYQGWNDHAVTALRTIRYYRDVVAQTGSKVATDAFLRLFLAPGMLHCGGGTGPNSFDSLAALEQWVEQQTPPDRLIASHSTDGVVDRTRPLCPYPEVARYVGAGSIDDAASFACLMPVESPFDPTASGFATSSTEAPVPTSTAPPPAPVVNPIRIGKSTR